MSDDSKSVIPKSTGTLDEVFAALDAAKLPDDFMCEADRDRRTLSDSPAIEALFVEDRDEQ